MSTPILDRITSIIGEGPILRKVKDVVKKVKSKAKEIIGR